MLPQCVSGAGAVATTAASMAPAAICAAMAEAATPLTTRVRASSQWAMRRRGDIPGVYTDVR